MLSVEEIKKGCEFADGFRIEYFKIGEEDQKSDSFHFWYGKCWLNFRYFKEFKDDTLSTFTDIVYPLFLQRVIEGINEDVRFRIKQENNILDVYVCDDFGGTLSIKQVGGYSNDQAKEKTIKYILDKIK